MRRLSSASMEPLIVINGDERDAGCGAWPRRCFNGAVDRDQRRPSPPP